MSISQVVLHQVAYMQEAKLEIYTPSDTLAIPICSKCSPWPQIDSFLVLSFSFAFPSLFPFLFLSLSLSFHFPFSFPFPSPFPFLFLCLSCSFPFPFPSPFLFLFRFLFLSLSFAFPCHFPFLFLFDSFIFSKPWIADSDRAPQKRYLFFGNLAKTMCFDNVSYKHVYICIYIYILSHHTPTTWFAVPNIGHVLTPVHCFCSPPARWGSLNFNKGATPSPPPSLHHSIFLASPGCCGP